MATAELIEAPAGPASDVPRNVEDLAEIIRAYNQVTEKLQDSHERLQGEVLRLRQELAGANAQLQRARRLSALGEMAAGIAHEVRNPLAAIQLYVTMIGDDLREPTPRCDVAIETARKVASAVRGINAIVTDVLTFARETRPRPQRLALSAIIDRAIEAHRPAIEAAAIRVDRSAANAHLEIDVDGDLLHQALLNLIRNAVEAMSTVQGERILTLIAAEEDGQLILTLGDSGPGISDADADRIFNPFFTTRNTGTGLGLAIVHRIVDAHDGSISVANDPIRGGAVFRVTLPLASNAADPDCVFATPAAGPPAGSPARVYVGACA